MSSHTLICSQEAFKKVDQEIPILLGEIAKKIEIPVFCVVSSVGANANSSNFYLRTKGKMEEGICNLDFEKKISWSRQKKHLD